MAKSGVGSSHELLERSTREEQPAEEGHERGEEREDRQDSGQPNREPFGWPEAVVQASEEGDDLSHHEAGEREREQQGYVGDELADVVTEVGEQSVEEHARAERCAAEEGEHEPPVQRVPVSEVGAPDGEDGHQAEAERGERE